MSGDLLAIAVGVAVSCTLCGALGFFVSAKRPEL